MNNGIENMDMVSLVQELNSLDNELGKMFDRLDAINKEVSVLYLGSSDNLVADYNRAKERCNEMLECLEVIKTFENKWCDVFDKVVANNIADGIPMINFEAKTLEEVSANLDLMATVLPEPGMGYQISDFASISKGFAEQYRIFLNKENSLLVDGCKKDLSTIEDYYRNNLVDALNEYKVPGDNFQYNVDGTVYILQDSADILTVYDAIRSYENKKENKEVVEIVGVPLSKAAPEVQAKFADKLKQMGISKEKVQEVAKEKTIELKSGAKVKLKQFAKKGKEAIKLIGSKIVATSHDVVEGLKHYYSDINIANNIELEERPALPAGNAPVINDDLEKKVDLTNELDHEKAAEVSSVKVDPVKTEPAKVEEPVYTIDETLEGYVKTENAINNNPELTDEQKKQWRDALWNDFDNFVEQNPETDEVVSENSEIVQESAISEDPKITIDSMDEYAFENYLDRLSLSANDLTKFNKLVSDYKVVNPNASDLTASKEALKVMTDEMELVKPNVLPETTNENLKSLENTEEKKQKPSIIIETMNEAELNEYINNLHLTMEEIEKFNQYQRSYKENYAGMSDYMIRKACIKQIADQREFNGLAAPKEVEVESKLR